MRTTLTIVTLATILTACANPATSSPPPPPREVFGLAWGQVSGMANWVTRQFYSDEPAMIRPAARAIEVGDPSVSAKVSIQFPLGREVGG